MACSEPDGTDGFLEGEEMSKEKTTVNKALTRKRTLHVEKYIFYVFRADGKLLSEKEAVELQAQAELTFGKKAAQK